MHWVDPLQELEVLATERDQHMAEAKAMSEILAIRDNEVAVLQVRSRFFFHLFVRSDFWDHEYFTGHRACNCLGCLKCLVFVFFTPP